MIRARFLGELQCLEDTDLWRYHTRPISLRRSSRIWWALFIDCLCTSSRFRGRPPTIPLVHRWFRSRPYHSKHFHQITAIQGRVEIFKNLEQRELRSKDVVKMWLRTKAGPSRWHCSLRSLLEIYNATRAPFETTFVRFWTRLRGTRVWQCY